MTSMTMNRTSATSPSSLSLDDSEESFVVLSRSAASESQEQMLSLNSMVSSGTVSVQSLPQIPLMSDLPNAVSTTSSMISELGTEEIQSKLESLLQENLRLKDTLSQNNLAMKKQFNTLVMWQEDVMKVHQSHKQKFEETKKLIANLRAENMELRMSAGSPTSYSANEENANLKCKISALEFELQTLREANIKYKTDQSKLVEQLEAKLVQIEKQAEETIVKLSSEIEDLKQKLISTQEKLEVATKQIIEIRSQIPTAADVQSNEHMKTQIKDLIAEIVLKARMLKEKTDLIDNLHEEISKLKIENEVVPILKTQVEVYQTDFNQERAARSYLKEEKDRLAVDLHHLQRRNEQLLQEVESLREGTFVHVPSAQANSSQQRSAAAAREDAHFTCPKCEFAFYDYQALENHVMRCIELDSLP